MAEATTTNEAPLKPLDEFGTQALERLRAAIEDYNTKAGLVKAASGDPQELLVALRDSYTEDEQVNKIRAAIEELDNKREALFAKRDELLKPVVESQVAKAKEGTEGVEAELHDALKTINAGKRYISDLYDERHLAALPKVAGKRGTSSSSGGGSGARRIRGFDVYVDGNLATSRNGKGEQVSNLATAAKDLKVETEVLREQFFAAAGTDKSENFPAEVTFTVRVGEGDEAQTHEVRCVKVKDGDARATEAPAA